MNTYTLRLCPSYRFNPWGGQPLTRDAIAAALEGAVIRRLDGGPYGQVVLELALRRPAHEDALSEIGRVLGQLGYSIVEATVSEWANSLVQGAVVGALGGGTAGSATRNAGVALLGAVAGAIAGGATGSQMQRVVATYRVTPTLMGWHFTQVQPQPGQVLSPA